MARISDAIGYDVEVSEPNGPAVHGYITDRWANSRQPDFDRWLAAHDRETAARAWDEGYRQGRSDQADHSMYHQTHTANPYREGGDGRG